MQPDDVFTVAAHAAKIIAADDRNVEIAGHGVLPQAVDVFTAQAGSRQIRACDEGTLLWVPLGQVHGLDWVDGDPVLLLRAMAARASGQTFCIYKGA